MAPSTSSTLSAMTTKQRLALLVCDFLSTSDGSIPAEDRESIEVAVSCIADVFKVDPASASALRSSPASQSLLQIYSQHEAAQGSSTAAGSAGMSSAEPASTSNKEPPTEEQRKEAEALKSKGNAAMARKEYAQAIDLYTQALRLHPNNVVFLSNRATAHSAAKDHASARQDAEAAVAVEPSYTKAWSRLGLARYALGDPRGAMEAYAKGIEHEGNGGSDAMKKGFETAKSRVDELGADGDAAADSTRSGASAPSAGGAGGMPDLSSLASMFGGGGGGGGGGMPDLSSIMSNPMFANMAQNLMSNPDVMNNLMSNPRLREMANQFGSGGGMPDFSSLMSDPNVAEAARNLMGGAGGAGRGSGGGNNSNTGGSQP